MYLKLKVLNLTVLLAMIDSKAKNYSDNNDVNCSSEISKVKNSGTSIIKFNDFWTSNYLYGICILGDSESVYMQAGFCLTSFNSSAIAGLCPYFATSLS